MMSIGAWTSHTPTLKILLGGCCCRGWWDFDFILADLLVPHRKSGHQVLGIEWQNTGRVLDPVIVLWAPKVLNHFLAVRRSHRNVHALDCWTRIEVTLVISDSLL